VKRGTISYNGANLFDGDVVSMQWNESEDEVSVTFKLTEKPGLADLIQSAISKQQNINGSEQRG
jgi:hypothetical protein